MNDSPTPPPKPADLPELQRRFSLPGLKIDAGRGGLPRILVQSMLASAEVYLHGAHITLFQPTGQLPLLFVSRQSQFTPGKPIRGGIPVIFPWFGPKADDAAAPMHGFARTSNWSLAATRQLDSGIVEIELTLDSADVPPAIARLWPNDFSLRLTVRIGNALNVELQVSNTSDRAFRFEEALHTYLSVGDVRELSVAGLLDTQYISKTENAVYKTQEDEPMRITGETDRVYLNTTAACEVCDESTASPRQIVIAKNNSLSTVVWNPWIDKAKAMSDFGDDEWPRMICIETANVAENSVELPPGASHAMRAEIRAQG